MEVLDMTKIESWLPLFSGFYSTIWESDNSETMEIEYINDKRQKLNKCPLKWDEFDFHYDGYRNEIAKNVTSQIETHLQKGEFVTSIEFQRINSPKYYNYSNDSIHVIYNLTEENQKNIKKFLLENSEDFQSYIDQHYTSYSGFISGYSNKSIEWLIDNDVLLHEHKLGAILNFITELDLDEIDLYYECENKYISVTDYEDHVNKISNADIEKEEKELLAMVIDPLPNIQMFEDYGLHRNQLNLF